MVLDLAECPGDRLLVLGNHDVDPVNQARPLEVHRTAVTLAAPGEPPLLLTYVPLLQVPHGCVNVHGHVHQKESPSRNRHINVSVEQLNYRPAKLSDIRRLARRLLEGRTVPGHSTRARLKRRRTHHAVTTAETIETIETPRCRPRHEGRWAPMQRVSSR